MRQVLLIALITIGVAGCATNPNAVTEKQRAAEALEDQLAAVRDEVCARYYQKAEAYRQAINEEWKAIQIAHIDRGEPLSQKEIVRREKAYERKIAKQFPVEAKACKRAERVYATRVRLNRLAYEGCSAYPGTKKEFIHDEFGLRVDFVCVKPKADLVGGIPAEIRTLE